MAKKDRAPYADTYRAKARDILAQAEAAADHLIATELRLLAKRYLMLALEIENGRRPRARSRRVTPRPQAPPADPRPSSDAGRGDS